MSSHICGIIAPMFVIIAMIFNIKFVLSRRKARRFKLTLAADEATGPVRACPQFAPTPKPGTKKPPAHSARG